MIPLMMPLMVGVDAIAGDVVGGDDDGGGRGALNWGTCKCRPMGTSLIISAKFPLNLPKYISLSGYCVRLSVIGL